MTRSLAVALLLLPAAAWGQGVIRGPDSAFGAPRGAISQGPGGSKIVLSANFGAVTPGAYASGTTVGPVTVAITRAGAASYVTNAGALADAAANQYRVTGWGLVGEAARGPNLYATPEVPAAQTVTVSATGYHTLSVWGPGSITFTAGTITASGLPATVKQGFPATINVSVAGTISAAAPSGTVTFAQVEAGQWDTLPIRSGTRAAEYVTLTPVGIRNFSNWAMRILVITEGAGRAFTTGNATILQIGSSSGANRGYLTSSYWDVHDGAGGQKYVSVSYSATNHPGGVHYIVVSCVNGTLYVDIDGEAATGSITGAGTGLWSATPPSISIGGAITAGAWFVRSLEVAEGKGSREKLLAAPELADAYAVAGLGDSLTVGASGGTLYPWTQRVTYALGPPYTVWNQGVNGYRTDQVAAVLAQRVSAARYGGGVVILAGINDVAQGYDTGNIYTRLAAMYDAVRAMGIRVVPVTILPARGTAWWTEPATRTLVEGINTQILAYCTTHSIACVDAYASFNDGANPGGLLAAYDGGDHLHINQAGTDLLATLIRAAFMPAAGAPTASPAAGTYTSTQAVTLSSTTPSSTIRYTTDGSAPTSGSPAYSTPLSVATTQTIRAYATASGYTDSSIADHAYTINSGTLYALDSSRTTTWNPGLNAVGGIPNRTTQCGSTINPSADATGVTDRAAINSAITACGTNEVVQLAAGTFYVNDQGIAIERSNVVLRGTLDGNGDLATTINKVGGAGYSALRIGNHWGAWGYGSSYNLSVDGAKGATSVTLASTPSGLAAGDLVLIDQVRDSSLWLSSRMDVGGGDYPQAQGWFNRATRMVGQINEVASVVGNVVSFNSPLHVAFTTANTAQLTRFNNTTRQYVGVEHIRFNNTAGGDTEGQLNFSNAKYSWYKHVESYMSGPHMEIMSSYRCAVEDSYFHENPTYGYGTGSYLISFMRSSSDNLVQNSILWNAGKVMLMRPSGGGNVIAYNYATDGQISDANPGWQETGINASHLAGAHAELFEGNQAFNFGADDTWGGAFQIVAFRNHLQGLNRSYTDDEEIAAAKIARG